MLFRTDSSSTTPASDSAVTPSDDHRHLLWARGYLYTSIDVAPPHPWWRSQELGGRTLHHDPRLGFAVACRGRSFVALLGIAVDIADWTTDLGGIAAKLLSRRRRSRDRMIEALDFVCGRYIVIDGRGSNVWVQSDATGMRPVHYSEKADAFSSHAHLLAEVTGAPRHPVFPDPNELFARHRTYALPGNLTPWDTVRTLTPNTDMHVPTKRVRRFYPRVEMARRDPLEVIDHLGPILESQLELLSRDHRLLISLTAGLDSRTTTAVSRSVADRATYFCYEFPEVRQGRTGKKSRDSDVSRELADKLGLDFRRVPMPYRYPEEPLLSITRANASLYSHPALGLSHLESGLDGYLHIRSNHYGIARRWYSVLGKVRTPVGPREMARVLTELHGDGEPFVEEFGRFHDLVDFGATEGLCDQHELLYWEHRMGTWIGCFLAESDVAYETYTVVNARHIYEWMMSVKAKLRRNGAVQRGLITAYWPEAMDFPVNGKLKDRFPQRA
ncbi:hypothetical protein [Salininema proteolyticum]|uniref:Asparagine synthetase domain-containing protein n=1 Tax=Salininema proteolyticum TaxID=1607685 RepID=A0ABV8U4N3_9ACTN